MKNKVIEINNLFKEYKLGVIGRGTLYRDLQSWWALKMGKEDPNSLIGQTYSNQINNLLALSEINFSIYEGEVLGVIGSNGAGKSTLLKILSRVTSPTKGEVKIKGKISSLLEVGTGFHPELTGRENIFLNGAINGMNKSEVSVKLNDIVNFAGVEKFLDTPVKRYSSGMHVRLGFAVAAFLEPDILIVDEVLAVGDADFQKKAINKMKEVSSNKKRTVIFVSHNMNSIKKLCDRVIVISKGKIVKDDNPKNAIDYYLGNAAVTERNYKKISFDKDNRPGGNIVKLESVETKNNNDELKNIFNIDEEIIIDLGFSVLKENYQICCSLGFTYYNSKNLNRGGIFYSLDNFTKQDWNSDKIFKTGKYTSRLIIPPNLLNEGIFSITVDIFLPPANLDSSFQVRTREILYFDVVDNFSMDTARGTYPYDWQLGDDGFIIRPKLFFETRFKNN